MTEGDIMTRRELTGLGLLGMVGTAASVGGQADKGGSEHLDLTGPNLEEPCRLEVLQLHQFFQDWFNAVLEPTDANFERFASVIDLDFVIISPEGSLSPRAPLLEGLRGAHGSWAAQGDGKIWIENYQLHRVAGGFAVVTYEEWQRIGGKVRTRLSTAFFGRHDSTPNGVTWLHLHEVWMPSG